MGEGVLVNSDNDVTVVIPTIPPRHDLLMRAVSSALVQTHQAAAISIAIDNDREGAAATRQRALQAVETPWVAFLDDDDAFMPNHLESLFRWQAMTGADYIFPWYQIVDQGGQEVPDSVLGHFGIPFNPKTPHQTTITTMVRTDIAKQAGFIDPPEKQFVGNQIMGEDFMFTLRCIELGAHIVHLPEITWYWHHHGANTSGQPDRW
jgi:hypothetical protein